MIKLTRLNHKEFYLNPMVLEQAEASPDVTLTLSNGKKIVITEKLPMLLERLTAYWKCLFHMEEKIKTIKESATK